MSTTLVRGYGSVSPENTKLYNVYRVQRVYRHLGMKSNLSEIALVAGVSERFMHSNPNIKTYWDNKDKASDSDISFVIESFIKNSIKVADSIEIALGAILGIYLRVETDLFNNEDSFHGVAKLGTNIVKLYRLCSYKEDGVPIHSSNESAKYIINSKIKNRLDCLFIRSETFRADAYSKKWYPSDLLTEYIKISIYKFFDVTSVYSFSNLSGSISHMLPKKTANSNIYYIYININIIRDFELNSIFYLLMSTVEINGDKLRVAIQNESSADESLGRTEVLPKITTPC